MIKKLCNRTIQLRLTPLLQLLRHRSKLIIFLLAIPVLTLAKPVFASNNQLNLSATVLSLVSPSQSIIKIIENESIADGQSTQKIVITARTNNGIVLPSKDVLLTSDHPTDIIYPNYQTTDTNGQAIFYIVSTEPGLANYQINIDYTVNLDPFQIDWKQSSEVKVLAATKNNFKIENLLLALLVLGLLSFFVHLYQRMRQDWKQRY